MRAITLKRIVLYVERAFAVRMRHARERRCRLSSTLTADPLPRSQEAWEAAMSEGEASRSHFGCHQLKLPEEAGTQYFLTCRGQSICAAVLI